MRFRLLLFTSMICGSLSAQKMSTQQYIEEYKYAAMQEMKIYGIPASVTLAQGILESASGNSRLAKDCNNHFGIKCRKNWTGSFCLADDDAPDECFRGYTNAMESYRDHSLFLKGASRYDFLFNMPATDYRAWAHGLRQAGYATNPAYGDIIVGVVERYRLSMYDSMLVLGEDYSSPDTAAGRLIQMHGLPAIIVSKSRNPEDIARLYDMGVWQIYKYNDLKRGEELKPGEILYLKPKKRKGDEKYHMVKEGETLRDISQQHSVKLKYLEKFNHVMASQSLKPGEVIYLRDKRQKDSLQKTVTVKLKYLEKFNHVMASQSLKPGEVIYLRDKRQKDSLQKTVIDRMPVPTIEKDTAWKNNEFLRKDDKDKVISGTQQEGLPTGKTSYTGKTTYLDIYPANRVSYHTVLAGETVYSISRLYNISVDSVINWNHLANANIRVGQELRVNRVRTIIQQKDIQTHTVSAGETLYQISRRYGISVSELQDKNNLKASEIKAGQVLMIP
ncbi:MAG: LysM peptidoglycan-binding domain-containing protein [Sphingomonadales bacterium]|nr:LysM peptidoglycan-binding domain-containing protein [Sphingomonadales bacterium]